MSTRFLVGIDLGTTNTVVAYTDRQATPLEIKVFAVDQLVAPGEVARREALPSVRYHPAPDELSPHDLTLPWSHSTPGDETCFVTGALARDLGSQVPGRLVASAKSWLSHPEVDRQAAILPWGAPDEIPKVSPVAASASYLAHVRNAWDFHFPDHPLAQQELILTVPASFDEAARALTVQAARQAGLERFRLVEEPQAAFYDYLHRHHDHLTETLAGIRLVLICDVGGGTTDLTLIKVTETGSTPQLERIGVGDHLMLGGDNMDLALAHLAEARLTGDGTRLGPGQLSQLIQQCRQAKERLLSESPVDETPVTLLGSGSRLIGGARSIPLQRAEVEQMVLEGFFPVVDPAESPRRQRSGLVEFGLPYAADPAITRHIAAFVAQHAAVAREALGIETTDSWPIADAVLLNGGIFRSPHLTERLVHTLSTWRDAPLKVLANDHPDSAVARGAVAYGLALAGHSPRIAGGSPRSYFLLLADREQPSRGVCLLPRGTEAGREIPLAEHTFALRVGQPVRLNLLYSTADTSYTPGQIVDVTGDTFRPLPPVATVVTGTDTGPGEIPVRLAVQLTEIGTLQTVCYAPDHPDQRWHLEFQLRGRAGAQTEAAGRIAELPPRFGDAAARIERMFGARSKDVDRKEIKRLRVDLEKLLGPRTEWTTPVLRELSGVLLDGMNRRRRSADHERVWFNLTGFCLRPGFGYPLDDWRIEQLWTIFESGVHFRKESQNWSEWWTLWRRTAGGLNEAAQITLYEQIAAHLPAGKHRKSSRPVPGIDDMIRLAGSLERLAVDIKIELGQWLLARLRKPGENPQTWWSLGRLGARVPFYGSAHRVVPVDVATAWLDTVMQIPWQRVEPAAFAAVQIARVSGDRSRDLPEPTRRRVADRLREAKVSPLWITMVMEPVALTDADEKRVFGESLPPGLRLLS